MRHGTRAAISRTTLGTCLALVISSTVLASGISLDVAPGLWEFTTIGSASGVPVIPPEAMERMNPQQRLMLQGLLIALVAQANTPHSLKFCITPDNLREGFDPRRMSYPGCEHHLGVNADSGVTDHLEMRMECRGHEPLEAQLRVSAVNHRTVEGDLKLDAGHGPDGLSLRQSVHGHWLGPDCGDTQPFD